MVTVVSNYCQLSQTQLSQTFAEKFTVTEELSWLYPDRGDFIAVVGRMQDINAVRQVKAALLSSRDLSVYSMNAPWFYSRY